MGLNGMDLIIDDGDHTSAGQLETIAAMWPKLKPGGYYFIEDIVTGAGGQQHFRTRQDANGNYKPIFDSITGATPIAHEDKKWTDFYRSIMTQNDVFFADTLVGHPHIDDFWKEQPNGYTYNSMAKKRGFVAVVPGDRLNHNSHIIAIRKRAA